MKKEILAATLLLVLILGAFWNSAHIENLTQAVAAQVSLSQAAAGQGDFDAACKTLDSARELWEASGPYTGIFMDSRDLETVTEAFFALKTLLLQQDTAAAPAAYERLLFALHQTAEQERLSVETVL